MLVLLNSACAIPKFQCKSVFIYREIHNQSPKKPNNLPVIYKSSNQNAKKIEIKSEIKKFDNKDIDELIDDYKKSKNNLNKKINLQKKLIEKETYSLNKMNNIINNVDNIDNKYHKHNIINKYNDINKYNKEVNNKIYGAFYERYIKNKLSGLNYKSYSIILYVKKITSLSTNIINGIKNRSLKLYITITNNLNNNNIINNMAEKFNDNNIKLKNKINNEINNTLNISNIHYCDNEIVSENFKKQAEEKRLNYMKYDSFKKALYNKQMLHISQEIHSDIEYKLYKNQAVTTVFGFSTFITSCFVVFGSCSPLLIPVLAFGTYYSYKHSKNIIPHIKNAQNEINKYK